MIGIVGDTVPSTTRLEIRRVYELRDLSQWRELWFFRYQPGRRPTRGGRPRRDAMPLADFLAELHADFKRVASRHSEALARSLPMNRRVCE